jgi:hypothetical protein
MIISAQLAVLSIRWDDFIVCMSHSLCFVTFPSRKRNDVFSQFQQLVHQTQVSHMTLDPFISAVPIIFVLMMTHPLIWLQSRLRQHAALALSSQEAWHVYMQALGHPRIKRT